ncbi:nucleotidyltransferase domain-containing protein, partial [Candidatus Gribaldobacteria bacterium]|nr:nucleotidyltransferase domain-containing protein [Candidatus Gribaldobacteria bacterium]
MNSENFFEKKINGEPVEKRFKLSREPFAKERIKAIKDSVKKLQGEYPEVLSLCLFGSMVKGNIKKTSDIDGYLFVDVDMVKEKHLKDKDLKITEEDLLFGESIGILFKEEIENEYSLGLKKKLFSILHLSAEQLEHLRITPISEEIIDRQVQDIVQQLKLISSYKESYRAWEESYPTEKVDDLKVLADYYKKKPEYPKLPRPSQNLRSMFHLDVGGGIR